MTRSGARRGSRRTGSARRRSGWNATASSGSKASIVSTNIYANYKGRARGMAAGSKAVTAPERTVVTTRVFDAPRDVVYRAWTDPKQLAQWFPPKDFTAAACEV